jgi:quercetin dioxygenase-like cupin family protein
MASHTVHPRSRAVVECTMRAADTTPLHAHEEDETIEVLEGSVTVYAGVETVTLTAGESYVVAAGVPHAHRAEAERVRYLATASVLSVGRYEDFLRAVGRPADEPGWASPEEAAAIKAIAAANRIAVLGAPGALPADRR